MQVERAVVVIVVVLIPVRMFMVVIMVMVVIVPVFMLVRVAVSVVVVPVVVVLMERVRLEGSPLAERPADQALGRGQLDDPRIACKRVDRAGESRLHRFVDQEDDPGLLQHRGVGRTHVEAVMRRALAHDEVRLADTGHHRAHQGVHRPDGGDDRYRVAGRRRRRGGACEKRGCGQREVEASGYRREALHESASAKFAGNRGLIASRPWLVHWPA